MASKLLRKAWGGVEGLTQEKQTMNDTIHKDFLMSGNQNLHTDSFLICSLIICSTPVSPVRAWLKLTYTEHKLYSLMFPPPVEEGFKTKVCDNHRICSFQEGKPIYKLWVV